jgi:hypothetical protein
MESKGISLEPVIRRFVVGLILTLVLVVTAGSGTAAGYHVVNTFKIGGEGGWDYLTVDSDARRVYISRGTM